MVVDVLSMTHRLLGLGHKDWKEVQTNLGKITYLKDLKEALKELEL